MIPVTGGLMDCESQVHYSVGLVRQLIQLKNVDAEAMLRREDNEVSKDSKDSRDCRGISHSMTASQAIRLKVILASTKSTKAQDVR